MLFEGRQTMPRLAKAATYIILTLAITDCTCRAQDKPDAPLTKQTPPSWDKRDDSQIGKSKLEKETGTINDRIFEVLPNYGTVETASTIPPLTTAHKFRIATASVFDWAAYPFNGALAAIAQAKDDPKEWGQGWGAYGKRYGESFADNSIGTYMTR